MKLTLAASARLSAPLEVPPQAQTAPVARSLAAAAPAPGIPRASLTVPYSPVGPQGEFDDSFLLTVPGQTQRAYLPVYRVATDLVGNSAGGGQQQQYRMSVEADGPTWVVTVHLEQSPSDALKSRPEAQGAQPLPQTNFRVGLSYTVSTAQGDFRKQREFSEVSLEAGGGLRASLRLESLAEQSELYAALTERDARAQLSVERSLSVGLPVEVPNPQAAALVDTLRRVQQAPVYYVRRIGDDTGYLNEHGDVTQPEGRPAAFWFENLSNHDSLQSGDVVRLRLGASAIAGISGGPARVETAQDPAPPAQRMLVRKITSFSSSSDEGGNDNFVSGPLQARDMFRLSFYQLEDGDSYFSQTQWGFALESVESDHPIYQAREAAISALQQQIHALGRQFNTDYYRVVSVNLPCVPKPDPLYLKFEKYVFHVPRPDDSDTEGIGLIQREVNGRHYYQDKGRPQRFYYLPDSFLLSPRADGGPGIKVRATTDLNTYVVEYSAGPVVDAARLGADQAALLLFANPLLRTPVQAAEFEPLLGDTFSLSMNIPSGESWQQSPRNNVVRDLHHEFSDALSLSADQLRTLYDALFTGDKTLFRGLLSVQLGDWAKENIPVLGTLSGDPAALWEQIFDPSIPANFTRPLRVTAEPSAFQDAQRIVVSFEYGGTALLTPEAPSTTTNIGQPIGDFVLRKPDLGSYRYTLSRQNGSSSQTSELLSGEGNSLRLR
jgi:hypothetical protein